MTDLAQELKALERSDGRLLPDDVVEAAKDPGSPLHSHFTWDDSEAARLHRINEARALIRRVRVEVTVHEVPLSAVAYVRDPEADAHQAGYRNIMSVRSEEDQARAAVVDEMKRVAAAVRRAKSVAAVLGMADDVGQIETLAQSVTDRAVAAPAVA